MQQPYLSGPHAAPGWSRPSALCAILVDLGGFEPPTSCLQSRRSPTELQARTRPRHSRCVTVVKTSSPHLDPPPSTGEEISVQALASRICRSQP